VRRGAIALLLVAGTAQADVSQECKDDVVAGQLAQSSHDLLTARGKLEACARDCPDDVVRAACGKWLQQVKDELPSIVVKSGYGQLGTDYTLELDGNPVTSAAGEPIDVNPGEHVVRVKPATKPPVEQRVVVNAGEKLRALTFEPPHPVEYTTLTRRPVTVPTYVFVGLGAAALVSFGVFGLWTLVEYSSTSSCTPTCLPSNHDDSFGAKTLAADISLGVAIASVATAVVLYLVRPRIVNRIPKTGFDITAAALRF
jgi:hypothetical protein